MQLKISKRAEQDMRNVYEYIALDNVQSAHNIFNRIRGEFSRLIEFPDIGRAGRVKGTRELILADIPYIIAYRVNGSVIEILAVMHTSRIWPDTLI